MDIALKEPFDRPNSEYTLLFTSELLRSLALPKILKSLQE